MMPMKKTFKDFKMGAPIYMLFRYGKVVFTGQDVPRVFSSEAHYEYNKTRFSRSYLPTDELVKYVPERRGEWIPVTERFPNVGEEVLVYSEHNGVRGGFLVTERNIESIPVWCESIRGRVDTGITHWMPLPLPPQEENKDD